LEVFEYNEISEFDKEIQMNIDEKLEFLSTRIDNIEQLLVKLTDKFDNYLSDSCVSKSKNNSLKDTTKKQMRLWIDTEFNEYKGELISLALVAEDGREWYGVRYCDNPGWWVREHVMPHLLQHPKRDADLRDDLNKFLQQFEAVHIISDWPGDIAHFCNFLEYAPGERIGPDVMVFEVRRDLPDTATTSVIPHNALEDARALAKVGRTHTM
jgi:hypothetical protein